jgi:hypothetical protein
LEAGPISTYLTHVAAEEDGNLLNFAAEGGDRKREMTVNDFQALMSFSGTEGADEIAFSKPAELHLTRTVISKFPVPFVSWQLL